MPSRSVRVYRQMALDRADDIQKIIDEKPSTCQIQRKASMNTINGVTQTTPTTFQCRIDPVKPRTSGITDYSTTAGLSAPTTYVLLALVGQDSDGNTVDIHHRDVAVVDGTKYRVTNVTQYAYKTEALLSLPE